MATTSQQLAKLEPVPFTKVTIQDRFWSPRQEINRKITVQHSFAMLERAGNFLDLQLAADRKREGYKGLLFTDSDLYKVLEGVAYTLATHPDPKLDAKMDEVISLISRAQMEDGYLNTWFQVVRPEDRFKNLRDWHELYCAGHLFEAACAHFQATGKRNLLDVALRFANLIDQRFGPNGAAGYCGHPELELALVKLTSVTKDPRWFNLSRLMVERRGSGYFAEEHKTPKDRYDGAYWLDDVPIEEHTEIKGHAVRAAYLLAGAADIARDTNDQPLLKMLDKVWSNVVDKRIFVTGGIGPSAHNEGFTVDYDLPTGSAYQETCASIAMALWGHRMALLYADAKYMDAVETALYNGMLSGIGLDGKSFFYVNPLASNGQHRRVDWFECACCPPNVLRTIASIGGYAYASSAKAAYVNLYCKGTADLQQAKLSVNTDYPWDGKVTIKVEPKVPQFALHLRVPGWCPSFKVVVNGQVFESKPVHGYVVIQRTWEKGDSVELSLEMPVQQVQANPNAKNLFGHLAVQRGPLIYCMEEPGTKALDGLIVPRGAEFKPKFQPKLLGGVVTLEGEGYSTSTPNWRRRLYAPISKTETRKLSLIPYGYWANRAPGAMAVWLPAEPPVRPVLGPESFAKVSLSFVSGNCQPEGINDGIEPKNSADQAADNCHFWPHKGGEEWAQYTWDEPVDVRGIRLYWFDDTGRGECRVPQSWKLLASTDGSTWKEVALKDRPVHKDQWIQVDFPSISVKGLRVVVQQQEGWASGILEWKVIE